MSIDIIMVYTLTSLNHYVAEAPNAMAIFDPEMRFLAASRRWLADLGLTQTPVGHSLYEAFPNISDNWKAVHRRCLSGATESVELERFETPDGDARWIRSEARPWTGADGRIGGIVISANDITGRVEAHGKRTTLLIGLPPQSSNSRSPRAARGRPSNA